MNRVSVLIKETPEISLTPSVMQGYNEKTTISKPGSKVSPDTDSELLSLQNCEKVMFAVSAPTPPILWYFCYSNLN